MKHFFVPFFAVIFLFFLSCKQHVGQQQDEPMEEASETLPTGDNSRSTLDWAGTYKGITPCADCAGIETVLKINEDLTYQLSLKYLGKSEVPTEYSGSFTWDETGSKIKLEGITGAEFRYLVGENKLFQLDQEGNRITGNLATKYELVKTL